MKKLKNVTLKEFLFYSGILAVCAVVFYAARIPLAGVILIAVAGAYLKVLSAYFDDKKFNILALSFFAVLGIVLAEFFKEYLSFSPYFIPVAAVVMLVTLLYHDLELALIFSVFLSILTGLVFGGDLYLTIVLLSGGIISALFVWRARRRSQIIAAGFYAGLIQALCVLIFLPHCNWKAIFEAPCWTVPFFNGVMSAFLVAGLLPLFEFLFKVVTNISLLELADFNHPLLKRLVLEAPGTYHHSLMVGNLAEMAAEVVGANPLLARVGAYYHDIGKLEKPEYFSENQDRCASKHDDLSASMSKMVIMEHVKAGVELAKKNRLSGVLIDFITQHHGTSLVYYFYRRALESTEDSQEVKEEVFRYPGPKPQAKETAIVLLADSVEAACRALDEPTGERISDLVRRIINNKFIDGQLDSCDLTLRDLDKISVTFIHILAGFYHTRIDYPQKP